MGLHLNNLIHDLALIKYASDMPNKVLKLDFDFGGFSSFAPSSTASVKDKSKTSRN